MVGQFILESIKYHPDQKNFTIETIGEGFFDLTYVSTCYIFKKYQEDPTVCEGNLRRRVESIFPGASAPENQSKRRQLISAKNQSLSLIEWFLRIPNSYENLNERGNIVLYISILFRQLQFITFKGNSELGSPNVSYSRSYRNF